MTSWSRNPRVLVYLVEVYSSSAKDVNFEVNIDTKDQARIRKKQWGEGQSTTVVVSLGFIVQLLAW